MSPPGRTFTKERFGQRIDEILELAKTDLNAAREQARRLLEWLTKTGSTEPGIEDVIENLRALIELLGQ